MAEAPVRWDDGEDDDLSRESECETDTESEETLVKLLTFFPILCDPFSRIVMQVQVNVPNYMMSMQESGEVLYCSLPV